MTVQDLRDLIEQRIKTQSGNTISPTKTTGYMLKEVLLSVADLLENTQELDKRYHSKVYGDIKLFYGNYFDLPKYWVLCDGTNGTPDLRGKVPLGWSQGFDTSLGGVTLSEYHHIGAIGGKNFNPLGDRGVADVTATPDDNRFVKNLKESDSINAVENRQPYMVVMFVMYVGPTAEVSQDNKVKWTELDSDGNTIVSGSSNLKYGFRKVSPAMFLNPENAKDTINLSSVPNPEDVDSNLGFIEESSELSPIEKWIHSNSVGDNLNT